MGEEDQQEWLGDPNSVVQFGEVLKAFQKLWMNASAQSLNLMWHSGSAVSPDHPPFDCRTRAFAALLELPYDPDYSLFSIGGMLTFQKDRGLKKVQTEFIKISRQAGTLLSSKIRADLSGYCPWDVKSPESWWFALLWEMNQQLPFTPEGRYINELLLTRPVLLSIEAIQRLRLAEIPLILQHNGDSSKLLEADSNCALPTPVDKASPTPHIALKPLGERAKLFLKALLKMNAIDADNLKRIPDVVTVAVGRGADIEQYNRVVSDLKKKGLVETQRGRSGGCWLTEAGKQRAQNL